MFDTMKIAKKIKEARIARNMTQMDLADAMGVSYQAVSNWERGNSMPDISKLEDLCNALELTVADLLGMESKAATAVEKVIQEEPLTVDELVEVAPVLPPVKMEEQTRKTAGEGKKKYNIRALAEIAPYLDEELLEEMLEEVELESLVELEPLAPYLDEEMLDKLVRNASVRDKAGILTLAPYLEEETLNWLVRRYEEAMDWAFLSDLAAYLDEDVIDDLTEKQIALGNVKALSALYPYMEENTLRKVAKALMELGDIEAIKEATEYM